MSSWYFPGCKYTSHNPEGAEKLKEYLSRRFGIVSLGCCSVDHVRPRDGDTVVYQCPTCGLILSESARYGALRSVYEILDADEQFPWPDHSGWAVTLQDCWRVRENPGYLDAVRSVLARMNVRPLELSERREKADFCGATLYRVPSPRYETLAPISLVKKACFSPADPDEQQRRMTEHGKRYQSQDVLCYCTGCLEGIAMGGHHPVHLLDVITDAL